MSGKIKASVGRDQPAGTAVAILASVGAAGSTRHVRKNSNVHNHTLLSFNISNSAGMAGPLWEKQA